MRALLGTGLALLCVSLLITVVVTGAPPAPEGLRAYTSAAWFANASLYVGAGLTGAGAALRALRQEAEQDEGPAPGRDWYAEE